MCKQLKFETRGCKRIPIEIDRLEYLVKYCVKNYYIKTANQVPNGDYYPKWLYENAVDQAKCDTEAECLSDSDDLNCTLIKGEEKIVDMTEKYNSYKEEYKNRASEVNELQEEINILKQQIDRVQTTVTNG